MNSKRQSDTRGKTHADVIASIIMKSIKVYCSILVDVVTTE